MKCITNENNEITGFWNDIDAPDGALDCDKKDLAQLAQRTIKQLRFIARGAFEFGVRNENRSLKVKGETK